MYLGSQLQAGKYSLDMVADNTGKCILGLNFKLAKNTPLTWAGVKEVAVHKQSLTPFRTCHRAVKTEMMLIPPFSEASVPGMVEPRPGENGLCVRGLSTKHATDKDTVMGHPRLTFQLINPTKAPTKIKHIYQVANCECVESATPRQHLAIKWRRLTKKQRLMNCWTCSKP